MLVQLIYCSAASQSFDRADLTQILEASRRNNMRNGITGMLLHSGGSFFQVLEGEDARIDELMATLERDPRHHRVTVIIREPIAERSFPDWSMGYADVSSIETGELAGVPEAETSPRPLSTIPAGRARKLMEAFKKGRWRSRVSDNFLPDGSCSLWTNHIETALFPAPSGVPAPAKQDFSFAFQPIVDSRQKKIFSYEALLRGTNQESAREVLDRTPPGQLNDLDSRSRLYALQLAANLQLTTHLNLNMVPSSAMNHPASIPDVLNAVERFGLKPEQVVLEVLESEVVEDLDAFAATIRQYRGTKLRFAIDDFGAGYAGLNMLAEFQPNLLKLDMNLLRGVDNKGPRQAIIKGIMVTATDLGIDVIAEGVETPEEYQWLREEGIWLFQGYLFAKPTFERLSTNLRWPAA